MFSMLLRPVLHILSYSVVVYILYMNNRLYGLHLSYTALTWQEILLVYVILWGVLRVGFAVLKKILDILAFPFSFLTFGLAGIVVNLIVWYVCVIVISMFFTGIELEIVSRWWLLLLSAVLSIAVTVVYKIIKMIV